MDLPPSSTSFNQPSTDEAADFYRFGVSVLVVHLVLESPGFSPLFTTFAVFQYVPLPVAPVPRTVQCPLSYASFAVTPIATPSAQYAHDTIPRMVQNTYPSLQHPTPSYPYIPPHTTLASVDYSVRDFLFLSSPTPPY